MKKTSIQLLLLITAGFLLFSCEQKQSTPFLLTSQEALQKAATGGYLIAPDELARIMAEGKDNLILVDLRTPTQFDQEPVPGAVNIPIADLLEKSSLDLLQAKENVVLLGNITQANDTWFLLTQMGLKDVKILESADGGLFSGVSETARYDYAALFENAQEEHAKELEAGKPKPVVKKVIVPQPKPKKKKVEEEEGC